MNLNKVIFSTNVKALSGKMFLCLNAKRVISKTLAFLLFLSVSLTAQEETFKFSHITVEDGLSINGVKRIIQDARGFLWFGTYNGLDRYDGYDFRIFLPDKSKPNSISNHSILSLCEDRKGYIWIATLDGLNRYNWKTDEFEVYKHHPNDPNSLSDNNITTVYEDKSGIIWVGTINGLNKYNPDKNNFTVFGKVSNTLNPDSLNSITCIQEDSKGIIWLGTWNGISCIKKDGTLVKQYYINSNILPNMRNWMFASFCEDKKKNLWIGLNGAGIDKYDPSTGRFTHYISVPSDKSSLSNDFITTIYMDDSGVIWIGTKEGLNRYNKDKNNFTRILHDSEKPYSIIDDEILTIKQDKTGLLWVGTNAGVSRYCKPINHFSYFEKESYDPQRSLISNRIMALSINKGNKAWVGNFYGFDEVDLYTKKVIHHQHEEGNENSLNDNFVHSILQDHKGIVWIGTSNAGLDRYDPSTGKFRFYQYDMTNPNSLSNNGVISLCEDHNGTIWAGTWWGLNRFDAKTESFFKYHANPSKPNSLTQDLIWVICEDSEGMIWLGTDGGGASRLDPKTGLFTNFNHDTSNVNHISANRIFSIFESKDGIMWLGTSSGLNSYDRKTGKITIYDVKSGLPGELVNGIQEDSKGFLWISTDKGLTKFDRKTSSFYNHTLRDGLLDLEFNQNVCAKSKSGILYFGSKKGLLYFNPDSIKDTYITAPIVFTDLKIYNKPALISGDINSILKESITSAKTIRIPYEDHDITIQYALLDYYDVKRNSFRYKLEGFDSEWNSVGSRNDATYTNLLPGEYNFIVRGSNNKELKNEVEASLKIIIVPAFYQTRLFQTGAVLVLLLTAFLTYRHRTRKIKKQNKILENRVNERTTDLNKTILELNQEVADRKKAEEKAQASVEEKEVLLKEVHHRVKNNLQSISSMLYLQSFAIKDPDTVKLFDDTQNRIKSMALIHEKLYQSKNLAEISFGDYINSLLEHMNRLFRGTGKQIAISLRIKDIKLSIDTAISCGLIVNELVTNAFKYAFPDHWIREHSGGKVLLIEISIDKTGEKNYFMIIRDNGIGIPDNLNIETTNSLGLKIVNSMARQINGTLEIVRNDGTEFRITFQD
jgi:two-component sensor histidine kinase/ligand-binding sensor domain-containing protein